MSKYRLGLDVGTNSLGWSVLELNISGEPCVIKAAGARIFSDGRASTSQATLAAGRREARSARRRRDRFKQRQKFLLDELEKAGLFPPEGEEREALRDQNPLELRARALKKKLEPYQIGRALFHLNQRRGFKSNRKDRSEETTSGKVSNSVRMLLEQMGLIGLPISLEEYRALSREDKKLVRQQEAKERQQALEKLKKQQNLTYGSFLYERHTRKAPTRARPGAGDGGRLYDVYPTRELYEDEFNKIWDAQAIHFPDLMTDDKKQRIHYVIFTQRPLKPQKRGQCIYMPEEKRTFRAMPSFQRYRIYQDVNALEWRTGTDEHLLRDHHEARDAIIELLEKPSLKERPTDKNAQAGFAKMKTLLKKRDLAEGDFKFNFETQKRNGFDGNLTSNVMQHEDYVGSVWHDWSWDKQDEFIDVILSGTPEQQKRDAEEGKNHKEKKNLKKAITDGAQDDKEIAAYLMREYHLSEYAAETCVNAPLVDGTANVSLKAARLILEKMCEGIVDKRTGEITLPLQSRAVEVVAEEVLEFTNSMRRPETEEGGFVPKENLPYYGEVFQDGRHIIPGDRREENRGDDRKYYGGITNPAVHIALNQLRQVVNELIKRYGHPHSIAIELGRDLPVGAEGRREIERGQARNQEENRCFDRTLHEYGQKTNSDNRLRLRLWEELDGHLCPFSGDKICITDLFNGNAEIEHLIPFSRSLDDSRANKVLCTRQANRNKGNRTPFEAFSHSPHGYDWHEILERAKGLPGSKQWRFQEDALEIWNRDCSDFSERHLNDTRYIGRLTKEYLESICPFNKIDVITGKLTALLRRHWGLNAILQNRPEFGNGSGRKSRDDHRHHAIDAIVVGMTTRSMLQKVSTAANHAETLELEHLFPKSKDGKSPIDPWDGFRDDVIDKVSNIIVSHRTRQKKLRLDTTDGQLHNKTAFGLVSGPDEKGDYVTVVRRPIDYLTTLKRVEAIRDPHLRQEFCQAFHKQEIKTLACEKGIRSIRCFGPKQAIPIKDKNDNPYKGYQGDNNWGMEIYAFPPNHEKADKWEGVVISRFDANKPDFKPGETHRPHPGARLVMRLQINECIEINQNNQNMIMRLQKIAQNGTLTFAPHNEANVANRHKNRNVTGTYKNSEFFGKAVGAGQNKKIEIDGEKIALDDPDLQHWTCEDGFLFLEKKADTLKTLTPRKVHISPTGQVSYENRCKPRCKKAG